MANLDTSLCLSFEEVGLQLIKQGVETGPRMVSSQLRANLLSSSVSAPTTQLPGVGIGDLKAQVLRSKRRNMTLTLDMDTLEVRFCLSLCPSSIRLSHNTQNRTGVPASLFRCPSPSCQLQSAPLARSGAQPPCAHQAIPSQAQAAFVFPSRDLCTAFFGGPPCRSASAPCKCPWMACSRLRGYPLDDRVPQLTPRPAPDRDLHLHEVDGTFAHKMTSAWIPAAVGEGVWHAWFIYAHSPISSVDSLCSNSCQGASVGRGAVWCGPAGCGGGASLSVTSASQGA